MGNRDAVVIELDSAPTALDVPTSGDYLERCVVSALFRPVLRMLSASRGSDYFEFVVDEGQRFSDGSAVQPAACAAKHSSPARHRRNGRGRSHT